MTVHSPESAVKANQGEWSELYVLVHLLGTGRLYAADAGLNALADCFFPILKVMRSEDEDRQIDMTVRDHGVEITCNGMAVHTVKRSLLTSYAKALLDAICVGRGAFAIPLAAEVMERLSICKVKASSAEKADITMLLHDIHTGIENVFAFSIKSYIGAAPTLLNASKSTNFVFAVEGLDVADISRINAIEGRKKLLERMQEISAAGGSLRYIRPASDTFRSNLSFIDMSFDSLLAALLLESYHSGELNCHKLLQTVAEANPFHVAEPQKLYEYKFKKFLCAVALGMQPAKAWSGTEDASGGYIIARADGAVVAYHIYNRNFFEEYLLSSTRLERASSSRNDYCRIYEVDGIHYINLNLQIRFKDHG